MASKEQAAKAEEGPVSGYTAIARALRSLGIQVIFGVLGIPVTELAEAAQKEGIRFISFRNEQAASMAAGAAGYLTGKPGVCVTVSGPGFMNGLAGLANATINCFPMLLLSGASGTDHQGRGAFQELDQVTVARPVCKTALRVEKFSDIFETIRRGAATALTGPPGGVYIDLPKSVLHAVEGLGAQNIQPRIPLPNAVPSSTLIEETFRLMKAAQKPLIVIGKGAALARAEGEIDEYVARTESLFLPTPMGKGLLPDEHKLSATAARSRVLREADFVLVVGARLNWILHYGEAPKWSSNSVIVQLDSNPEELLKSTRVTVPLLGDARLALKLLNEKIKAEGFKFPSEWRSSVLEDAAKNADKLEKKLISASMEPLDYHAALRIVRDSIRRSGLNPVIVTEGANTMDFTRLIVPGNTPRSRLDAGTWGTMGVGLGYAIAAACTQNQPVIAIEGDSAFGFSGMEVETMVRYKLNVIILVFNNGGIYGGNGASHYPGDPASTSFVPGARYDKMMESMGGHGYNATDGESLSEILNSLFLSSLLEGANAKERPVLVNVVIDPNAGSESGSMQGHNFAKKSH